MRERIDIPKGCVTVLISGPTASGKSGLALDLAAQHDGIIINADALQVYDCWRVLTSRPSEEDHDVAPHFLYGHQSCRSTYSVGQWLTEVQSLLSQHQQSVKIIVGGTGLYFTALTSGLTTVPPIKNSIRQTARKMLREGAIDLMLTGLQTSDPETFSALDRNNPRRVQRAWEVLKSTGMGLAAWQKLNTKPMVNLDDTKTVLLEVDPNLVGERIATRVDRMIKDGVLVECLKNLPLLELDLPSAKAIGAKEFTGYLMGKWDFWTAKERTVIATRQYAKRQRTWFRRQFADWNRYDVEV